jgi:hypothetical protein
MLRRVTVVILGVVLVPVLGAVPAASTAAPGTRSPSTWELNGRRGDDLVTTLDPHLAVVIPGSARGPVPAKARHIDNYQVAPGHSIAAGDLNGDGFGDFVYADPSYNRDQGTLMIVPGGPGGPRTADQYLVTNPYLTTSPPRIGASLLVADLDRDGYDDVITTSEYTRLPDTSKPYRRLLVFWGGRSNAGFDRSGELWGFEADAPLLLAAGNVTGNGDVELIAIDPGAAPTAADPQGAAGRLWWCSVTTNRNHRCAATPRSIAPGIDAVAVGDVAGGRRDDVVLGQSAAYDTRTADVRSRVWVHRGTRDGLANPQRLTQDSRGVPGSDEAGDAFGAALVIGDVNRDGKADLVVGAPGELRSAGRVTVLYGHRRGLGHAGGRLLSQETPGIANRSDANDRFGAAVSLLDVDGDGELDIAIGAPGENGSRGAITVVPTRSGRPAPRSSWRFVASDLPESYYQYERDNPRARELGRWIGR